MRPCPTTNAAGTPLHGTLAFSQLALGPATARQERAERALREANEHLAAGVQSSPLAIYTLDPASTVRSRHRAAEARHGWPAEEVIGRPPPAVGHGLEAHGRLGGRVVRGVGPRGE